MRKRLLITLGAVGLLGVGALAIACGSSTEETPKSDTTSPILPDGAVNPAFDGSQPPVLEDGAVNPAFDGSQPPVLEDGAVNPNFDASSDSSTDASRDSSTVDAGRDASTTPDSAVPPVGKVVGLNGIAAWDALAAAEKAKVNSFRSSFFHQSVGQDLEDGLKANGISIEFATTSSIFSKPGFHGGLFTSSNGMGASKLGEYQSSANANKSGLRVAIMKFGYADVVASTLTAMQTAYLNTVNTIKGYGVRVLHVTPPFVYSVPAENAPKMQMRAWMISTFPNDVIFDLEDAESINPTNGSRCERGGSWEICDNVRSFGNCVSLSQGADALSGQGHLCYTHAKRISKAFAYAIYSAGK
jgi:hypothetical protein